MNGQMGLRFIGDAVLFFMIVVFFVGFIAINVEADTVSGNKPDSIQERGDIYEIIESVGETAGTDGLSSDSDEKFFENVANSLNVLVKLAFVRTVLLSLVAGGLAAFMVVMWFGR